MNDNKVYVEVIVKFSTEGAMMPIEFIWEDGTKYLIDKVKSKERCASRKAGGTGIMYTVCLLYTSPSPRDPGTNKVYWQQYNDTQRSGK